MIDLTRDLYGTKLYPLADFLEDAEIDRLGLYRRRGKNGTPLSGDAFEDRGGRHVDVFAIKKVFRKPKKGEWYLSGAIVEAYKAPHDLSIEYWVAEIRTFQRVEYLKEVNLRCV